MKIEGWRARWLIAIGFRLIKLWSGTLRFEIDDRSALLSTPLAENYIGSLWHNRLLLIPFVLNKFAPHRPGAGLISASRDGDLIAPLTERFGFQVVRGSSSRMGASATLELAGVLASGRDVLMTPDGPRGPIYALGPGINRVLRSSQLTWNSPAAGASTVGTDSSCRVPFPQSGLFLVRCTG